VDRAAAVAVPAALAALEQAADLRVSAGRTDASHPLAVVVRDLEARRADGTVVRAGRVRVRLSPLALLRGDVEPAGIVAEDVRGAWRAAGISIVWSDTLLVAEADDGAWRVSGEGWAGPPGSDPVPFRATLTPAGGARLDLGAPLSLPSPVAGLTVAAHAVEVPPGRGAVRLEGVTVGGLPEGVHVRVDHLLVTRGDQAVCGKTAHTSPLPERCATLTGLDVTTSLAGLRELSATLRPRPRPAGGPRPEEPLTRGWRVDAPAARLALRLDGRELVLPAADLTLRDGPSATVATPMPWLGPEARLVAELTPEEGAEGLAARFDARLSGGSLSHPAISRSPLENLHGRGRGVVTWSEASRGIHLALEEATFRGASLALDVTAGPLLVPRRPAVSISLHLPEQPCQALADAVPAGMWSKLAGLELEGRITAGLDFSVDLEAVKETITLTGEGDPAACQVATLGPEVDVDRLNSPRFVHEWPRSDGGRPIRVGPGSRRWVPLDLVPAPVRRAMIVTEDGRFWGHAGINLGLVRKAIRINLEKGRYVYGGSTITQQLVKNLFVGPDKTLARKLEEAIVALHLERVVEKRRILELYVNVIEFGPDVYGIGRAAHYYFDSSVPELTPVEGAFLATIKPKPSAGPRLARQGRFRGWWHYRVIEVMGWLEEGGFISPIERARAFPFYPTFRGQVLTEPPRPPTVKTAVLKDQP